MELQHFLHAHKLSLKEVVKENGTVYCDGCTDIINGPAYSCQTCKQSAFVMHKSCAELPLQMERAAFHPHPLRYNIMKMIVCDRCGDLSACFGCYSCMFCTFNLDIKCATVIFNNENDADKLGYQRTTIQHFSHRHQLIRCKLSLPTTELGIRIFNALWKSRKSKCMACKQELQGSPTFACLPCQFVVHESCINDMPKRVRSPFHPQHVLVSRRIDTDTSEQVRCCACGKKVRGVGFFCYKCNVELHVSCAKYRTRVIKHNCHSHDLLHLGKSVIKRASCNACRKDCSGSFFRCIKCDFNVHPECIPLPTIRKHKHHLHPLELELEPIEEMLLDPQRMEENFDKLDGDGDSFEFGRLRFEKSITKDVFHPHPLKLSYDAKTLFVCDGCEELSHTLSYKCDLCSFNLDVTCATLSDDSAKHKIHNVRKIKRTISHFSHDHRLTRCRSNVMQQDTEFGLSCAGCKQGLRGLIYACLYCQFILHESCLDDMPKQVRSQFHPQHVLLPFTIGGNPPCSTCKEGIQGIAFTCSTCGIAMHSSCATYQTREIKPSFHANHRLQHLGKSIFVKKSPLCIACRQACNNTMFSCLKCGFHLHLECIRLPYIVKHKRHLHPLTLTNSVIEDDVGEYYCDTCETKRNSEHDVYYCKECAYVSHIDCVISEVEPPEKILKYLTPRKITINLRPRAKISGLIIKQRK
ncbi:hypothetical protein V6N13_055381 [Hibiscus sabdariffa]|uniref:Phorbol-ester/DAG-type domain-containing protein n=2 Tax=Hibiscus sabdariffa TaxID=183260 RepID=A0ABR1ZNL1_9ROSI